MEFAFSAYTLVYAAAALVSVLAAAFAWMRRRAPGGVWLAAMSLACAIWAIAVGLDYSSTVIPQHVFWGQVSYLGATTAPVFFFVFAFAYVGTSGWQRPRRVAMLLAIPVCAIVMAFTNDSHHLVWPGFSLVAGQPNLIIYSHGPAYWVVTLYGLALTLVASVRLMSVVFAARTLYLAQGVAIGFAVLLPWVAQIGYSVAPGVLPGADPSVTLSFTSAVLSFTMLRFNLLDVVPVPRAMIVEEMTDGVLVLDGATRVIEINPAAVRLLGIEHRPTRIMPVRELLVHWPEAVDHLLSHQNGLDDDPLVSADGVWLGVDRSRLRAVGNGPERDLYVLRDITARARAEQALHAAVEDLSTRMAEIETLQAELQEQAIRDMLTGLHNRRYLAETFDRELGRAAREGYPVSIVMFDIDYFKEVNDTLGHAAGDAILRAVGAELSRNRRAGDIALRYGGDEFLVVLPNTPLGAAADLAEGWRVSLKRAIRGATSEDTRATLSFGVAAFPAHATTSGDLVAAADAAVYASKSAGRNRVTAAPAPCDVSDTVPTR